LVDEVNGHALLAMATAGDTAGRFSHVTQMHLKKGTDNELEGGEDPTVVETSCANATPQNEDSPVTSSDQVQMAPAMEHLPDPPPGGGYQDPNTLHIDLGLPVSLL